MVDAAEVDAGNADVVVAATEIVASVDDVVELDDVIEAKDDDCDVVVVTLAVIVVDDGDVALVVVVRLPDSSGESKRIKFSLAVVALG